MPLFDYSASDRDGAMSHGQIEAPDKVAASKLLAKQGLFVMGVTIAKKTALPRQEFPKEPEPCPDEVLRAKLEAAAIETDETVPVPWLKKMAAEKKPLLPQRTWSRMDRALYLRQLQVMFEASIPLYRSASVLAEGKEYGPVVSAKLREVPLDLERGRTLSKSLERSGLFSPVIVSSVRLGEESGKLDTVLDALSNTEERAVQLTRALISRLTYPAVVMVAMSVGLMVMGHVMSRVMSSLPAFQKSATPLIAQLTRLFQHPAFFPILIVLLALIGAGIRQLWIRPRVRLLLEDRMLALPVMGDLLRRVESNTVTGYLALLIKAGLPIDRGVGLCADLVGTLTFRQALLLTQRDLRHGEELGVSLKRSAIFPEDVLALAQAGEMSGSLESSLETASRYCADQVERTLEAALAILEPLLIGFLGVAIGAVLILTFVPIFASLKDI